MTTTPHAPKVAPRATATDLIDPYLELEEINDSTRAWVTERSQRTLDQFGGKKFGAYRDAVAEILSAKDKLDLGTKRGEWIYNFYTDGDYPRGLWRRAAVADYLANAQADIEWEVLLDVGALGEDEGQSWVFRGASLLYPTYDRALVTLSPGGSDSNVVREFDVEAKSFLESGFVKGDSKGAMSWVDRDTVVISADFGPGTLTDSGYPNSARLWRRGQDLSDAPVIVEGSKHDVVSGAHYDHTPGHERLLTYRATDFRTTIEYLVDIDAVAAGHGGCTVPAEEAGEALPAALTEILLPRSAEVGLVRDWALLTLRHDWELEGRTIPAGALAILPFDRAVAGPSADDVQVLYEPTASSSFLDLTTTKSGIILTILDNVKTRLFFCADPHAADQSKDERWEIFEVTPRAAEFATVSVAGVDPDESDDVWLTISDFLTPTTLYHGPVSRTELHVAKLRAATSRFNAEGLEIRQQWAQSADGTKVPYFIIGPTVALEGQPARTLLDGYGGFEVSRLPSYISTYGKVWLEEGGVYVVANIRGGGEFGPAWHQAALKANRNKAYEDFAAVAKDLVSRGHTTVDQLGAIGGSNGGLLMGNMYTTYPELFGAIVCRVPLLDMKRFSHLLAGASWMGEYGDPDTEDWSYMERYSAYHNVGTEPHPPILLTTSTRDDRVHPGHARKFHALLEEMGHETWLYENTEGGHAGAADIEQVSLMTALIFSFLDQQLAK
ncbi:prolyl oligopeptidase family serine peptidase [Trueperella pecoris]|uniref:prolyl oligopeptidase family serine peptidase n=1 Tax=Trueperella pecoris TaxID=2733571 RepID=UPI001ABDD66C|nr:prolyl oligopeptidase family serine peptidase [Trueperella pecoris]QTG75676.1 S9 family peptidase [Trueperella pecoris]